ncbi:MAG: NAD(P)H-binding protein [Myxococcales bacterium]|nr:NAD(P)H-binding protein [Myxococcales bacterium]MCB9715926.1 NAD(P)H-binding protein [Myxococcales bacterium]
MSIVINTPNGNIGRRLALTLLDLGESITVISRDPAKASELAERGARVVQGSIEDEATLREAFAGATGLFWLTPSNLAPGFHAWARAAAERAATLAAEAGIERVVVLSSTGAHSGAGVGPVSALGPVEHEFESRLPHVVSLRAGFFMENYLRDLGTIAAMGKIFSPAAADHRVPMVATSDIAQRAAELLHEGWQGHLRLGVHGPRDLSPREGAQIVGQALGREVEYVQVTPEQALHAMLEAGIPEFAARLYVEMFVALNEGRMDPAEPRDDASTTSTELADFTRQVLRPAVAQAAAQ